MTATTARLAGLALAGFAAHATAGSWAYDDATSGDASSTPSAVLASDGRGAGHGRLIVRGAPGGRPRVELATDAGRVVCGHGGECVLMARFDGARWEPFRATAGGGGGTYALVAADAARFVERAAASRRIDLSFTADGAGTRFLEFTSPAPLARSPATKP